MVRRAFVRIRRVHLNAVVLHVTLVRVMQVAIVQIVRVAIVFQGRMAAIGAVLVRFLVPLASVLGSAVGRIGRIDGQSVFFNLVPLDVVQVAVVQIIDVAIVHDSRVAATRAVLVRMPLVMMCNN